MTSSIIQMTHLHSFRCLMKSVNLDDPRLASVIHGAIGNPFENKVLGCVNISNATK